MIQYLFPRLTKQTLGLAHFGRAARRTGSSRRDPRRWVADFAEVDVLEDRTLLAITVFSQVSQPIPDTNAFVLSAPISIVTGAGARISEIGVSVEITHTSIDHLDLFLVTPTGAEIELSTDNGGSSDNMAAFFITAPAPSIATALPPFQGEYQPEGIVAFQALRGSNPNGQWQVKMRDDTAGAAGTLTAWAILVRLAPDITATPAGNTLILSTPAVPYDDSNLELQYSTSGLTVTTTGQTRINGQTTQYFAGVNSVLGLFGAGNDSLIITDTATNVVQQNHTLLLGGGENYVQLINLNAIGATFIESSAGEIKLDVIASTLGSLLLIGGKEPDEVSLLANSKVNSSTTLLLGAGTINDGGQNKVSVKFSELGSTYINTSGDIFLDTDDSVFASLIVIGGGTGTGDTVLMNNTTINGTALLLLGGGFGIYQIQNSDFNGFTQFDLGSGGNVSLFLASTTFSTLYVFGGQLLPGALTFQNTTAGPTTIILGGGSNTIKMTANSRFNSTFTLFAGAGTLIETEQATDGLPTRFDGAALFILGAGSNVNFGKHPLPSDETRFSGPLTIIGTGPVTYRKRNVVNLFTPTLSNVAEV